MRRQFYLEWLRDYDLVVYGHRWESVASNLSNTLQKRLTLTTFLHHDLYPILRADRIVLNIS